MISMEGAIHHWGGPRHHARPHPHLGKVVAFNSDSHGLTFDPTMSNMAIGSLAAVLCSETFSGQLFLAVEPPLGNSGVLFVKRGSSGLKDIKIPKRSKGGRRSTVFEHPMHIFIGNVKMVCRPDGPPAREELPSTIEMRSFWYHRCRCRPSLTSDGGQKHGHNMDTSGRAWEPFFTACAHRMHRVPRNYPVFPGSWGGLEFRGVEFN